MKTIFLNHPEKNCLKFAGLILTQRNRKFILLLLSLLFLINHHLLAQINSASAGDEFEERKSKNLSSESGSRDLQSGIWELINDPFFERTMVAIDIFDLTDSISLFQYDNRLLLRPASNMKLLTSVAALVNLGEYYTFRTDLYHTGVIEGNTLYGDIFVAGGFDPHFTDEDLDSLVSVIKSLGIKYITGGVYADISKKDSMYWAKGWMWDDDPEPGAPYLSALNINGNSIEVFVQGSVVGSPAVVTLQPDTKFVEVENYSVTVNTNDTDNVLITRDWVNRKNTIVVSGKVRETPVIDSSFHKSKVNILYPERYFLTLFKERLESKGILVNKPVDVKRLVRNPVYLTTIYCAIDTVLSELNKNSNNLNAEMLVYAMAYNDSGAPATSVDGLAAVKRFLDTLGFRSEDYSIADGSGVSHYNLVSAELLVETLKFMYYRKKDLFPLFYNSLAIAGVDGTLKNRMKSTLAEGNVHAKTGTLNGVSNLSGFVTSKNGHLISFTILIQNFTNSYSTARSFQDKICILLAEME